MRTPCTSQTSSHTHTFYWNKEMMGLANDMKNAMKDKYDEKKYFVGIRPDERDGKWNIEAYIKLKVGGEKNSPVATWAVPPMYPYYWKKSSGWVTATWAPVAVGNTPGTKPAEHSADQ